LILHLYPKTGSFAEDKDVARRLRTREIEPALRQGDDVSLDFESVQYATQSFAHALLSPLIRDEELRALDLIEFLNCSSEIQSVIELVADYSQEEDPDLDES
jgi:hypothetical protein